MRRRSIGVVVVTLVTIMLAQRGGTAPVEHREVSTDVRERVLLPPAGRNKILAEMRHMLGSIGGILRALALNDLRAAEKAARASGMNMAADVDPEIRGLLPQPFIRLGVETHEGFDGLADKIGAGGTREDIVKGLAGVLGNCVACHAIYRLDEAQ